MTMVTVSAGARVAGCTQTFFQRLQPRTMSREHTAHDESTIDGRVIDTAAARGVRRKWRRARPERSARQRQWRRQWLDAHTGSAIDPGTRVHTDLLGVSC